MTNEDCATDEEFKLMFDNIMRLAKLEALQEEKCVDFQIAKASTKIARRATDTSIFENFRETHTYKPVSSVPFGQKKTHLIVAGQN